MPIMYFSNVTFSPRDHKLLFIKNLWSSLMTISERWRTLPIIHKNLIGHSVFNRNIPHFRGAVVSFINSRILRLLRIAQINVPIGTEMLNYYVVILLFMYLFFSKIFI